MPSSMLGAASASATVDELVVLRAGPVAVVGAALAVQRVEVVLRRRVVGEPAEPVGPVHFALVEGLEVRREGLRLELVVEAEVVLPALAHGLDPVLVATVVVEPDV